jgi:ATP-binding cassette, subfamily B, multidrug efflux pump
MKELQHLNKYFAKYKYHFIFGILITIVAQIFSLVTPKLIGQSFDLIKDFKVETDTNILNVKSELLNNLLYIVGATIVYGILTFFKRQSLIVMSRHIEFDLKNEVFRHYENLSQNFYKKNRTGDLMNRISEDVSKVRMYVGPAVMYSIDTIVRFTIIISFMWHVSPELTLYTLLPLPLLSFFIYKLSTEINKRSSIFQQNLSKLSSVSQEVFTGIRVIKAYSIEDKQKEEFSKLSEESRVKNLSLVSVNALFGPLMILLIGLSNLIVIYVGGTMYMNGSITSFGVIAEFVIYINMLTWPVASIGWVSSLIQEAEASQKRINEFLKISPEIKNTCTEPFAYNGNIEFKNVSYTYDDTGIQALKNISFTLNNGETLAILGKTGSGKSTILSLLCRLYDVTKGEILLEGKPIQQLNLNDVRAQMGIVPQDAFLFSDSIKNNIRFGKEDATDEEIIAVAKQAVVHHNILDFPKQYETVLGERGITLSGGQKQRVSIARALIKNPKVYLFDDCLSAVDTETEEQILSELKKISNNKTTLIVSHRVSSAKNANKIIILDEGEILQQGTHTQLINIDGPYRELYLKQLTEKEMQ